MRRKLPWCILVFLSLYLFCALSLKVAKPMQYTGTSISISANVEKMDIDGEDVRIAIGADHYFALQKDQLSPVTGKATAPQLGFKVAKYYFMQQPISSGTWVVLVPGVLDIQLISEKAMTVTVRRTTSAIVDDIVLIAEFVFFLSIVSGVILYIAQNRKQKS